MAILDIRDLGINFGGLRAVSDFNLSLDQHELVGIIGPNGAGKTTIFNMITGEYKPTNGSMVFRPDGNEYPLVGRRADEITKMGIARTFQNIRLFKDLSVIENVKIAYHFNVKYGISHAFLRLPAYHREEEEIHQKALDFLDIFDLKHRQSTISKNLPYGEQRRLEIARALATQPKILLLDEPAAGMNPQEIKDLMRLIVWIKEKFDLTIILIEHHMEVIMGVCKRILVLDYGITIAEGSPDEIKRNPRVIEAYLGEEAD